MAMKFLVGSYRKDLNSNLTKLGSIFLTCVMRILLNYAFKDEKKALFKGLFRIVLLSILAQI